MENSEFLFHYQVYSNIQELPEEDQNLVKLCISAAESAYAPYSKFNVGAALQLKNGEVITGSNQENAAYPSGLCAERVTLNTAGHLYPGVQGKTLAISANTGAKLTAHPITPCGACRQVMAEFITRTKSELRLILVGEKDIYVIQNAMSLLPLHFGPEYLS